MQPNFLDVSNTFFFFAQKKIRMKAHPKSSFLFNRTEKNLCPSARKFKGIMKQKETYTHIVKK